MTNTSKTIEIIVKPDGSTSLETKGFSGNGCRAASEFLEQALGQQVDELLKPEFHQSASTQQHLREGH